jgi:glycosyltransferase involved in cell wall biosynthesis
MKPIILTFTAFYLPGYRGGGPIRTIANMVDRLSEFFDFRIVTSDRDFGDAEAYSNIVVNSWNEVGVAKVYYADKSNFSLQGFASLMRDTPHDLIYLNSFFDTRFTLRPAVLRWLGFVPKVPVIIAPRGEFSAGAISLKTWKKKPYIYLITYLRIFNNVTWHASTKFEALDIENFFPSNTKSLKIASNIIASADFSQKKEISIKLYEDIKIVSGSALRICFLSRIAPMKNLEFALRVLAEVNDPIVFNIFGPKEDAAYWSKCCELIEKLPGNIKIEYFGGVEQADVRNIISKHDVFFVPTLGENFGHVFIEALSAGVPILVSDKTPWRNLEHLGIGWDIPLNRPERFIKAIKDAAKFNIEQRHQISMVCKNFAQLKASNIDEIQANRELFVHALSVVI